MVFRYFRTILQRVGCGADLRECEAPSRCYTRPVLAAKEYCARRAPDPLATRSVRRASGLLQTALSATGPPHGVGGDPGGQSPWTESNRRRQPFQGLLPIPIRGCGISGSYCEGGFARPWL